MNEKEVLKLAEEIGDYFSDDYGDRCVQFNNVTILAFANACCDVQRESDAKVCDIAVNKYYGDMPCGILHDIAKAIRANKGE